MANASPNIPEWQHKENLKQIESLKKDGYRFKIGVQSYQVWHKDKYLGGAGTIKFPHGRYHKANYYDNTKTALIVAQSYHANLPYLPPHMP